MAAAVAAAALAAGAAWASNSAEMDFSAAQASLSGIGAAAQGLRSASKAPAKAPEFSLARGGVNLDGQFVPDKPHNQGQIGSCHDFAAVALVEAAYYRRYKVHLPLSEADMFAQGQIATGKIYNQASVYQGAGGGLQCALGEGGWEDQDVALILRRGILPLTRLSCSPYGKMAACYEKQIQKPVQDAMLNLAVNVPVASASGHVLPKVKGGKALDKMKILAAQLEGAAPDADQRRLAVKQSLKGFKQVTQYYYQGMKRNGFDNRFYDQLRAMTPAQCEAAGEKQGKYIVSELNKGRPVMVGFALRGDKQWGFLDTEPNSPAKDTYGHAFLITGYTSKGGLPVFRTYNSWAKVVRNKVQQINPPVLANQLCRVMQADSLLTPEEAAQAERS
jgi:hypothetical protein